jgi:hypothetical protein
MTVNEIGLALAVYCKLHGVEPRDGRRYLEPTPQGCFLEAVAWADSNAKVVRLLRDAPDAVRSGGYSLSPARSWLRRVLRIGKSSGPTAPDDAELASVMKEIAAKKLSPTKKRKDYDEIRALVDESFDGR